MIQRDRAPDLGIVDGALSFDKKLPVLFLKEDASLSSGVLQRDLHQLSQQAVEVDFDGEGARGLQDRGEI